MVLSPLKVGIKPPGVVLRVVLSPIWWWAYARARDPPHRQNMQVPHVYHGPPALQPAHKGQGLSSGYDAASNGLYCQRESNGPGKEVAHKVRPAASVCRFRHDRMEQGPIACCTKFALPTPGQTPAKTPTVMHGVSPAVGTSRSPRVPPQPTDHNTTCAWAAPSNSPICRCRCCRCCNDM